MKKLLIVFLALILTGCTGFDTIHSLTQTSDKEIAEISFFSGAEDEEELENWLYEWENHYVLKNMQRTSEGYRYAEELFGRKRAVFS